MERITYYIRDLSEVLAAAIWDGPLNLHLKAELRESLSMCLTVTADVLRAWEDDSDHPVRAGR